MCKYTKFNEFQEVTNICNHIVCVTRGLKEQSLKRKSKMRKGENNVVNTPKKDMVIKEIMLTFECCIIQERIVKIFS